ncbi:M48 family metallopeptidase [Sphingomonas endophytica]|uniref:Metal-dependent hydrolase n=1 Tax=Sphingomonas endophytica TaxID=869719 RepID=A0A147I877_9SPHN|nr:YgjP-like metallopeptidase domain-containing protein [Sphingomonas endophytica]KTT75251.1 metal-dependent hydrolase [Sphingomonas endophytica]
MNDDIQVVRHPRARRTRLSFDPVTGRARLTIPARASATKALAWARAQDGWIASQRQRLPVARPFVAGAILPVDGVELTIDWSAERSRLPRIDGDRLLVGGPVEMVPRRIEAWLRRRALALLEMDTAFYADRAGVSVNGVAVGDPRGRWGSCASHGAIRYSWRLVLAPAEVRRATAAHEVAHRVHMDHSPAFHALVARLYGREPTAERAWLRAHGASLHWFGRSPDG